MDAGEPWDVTARPELRGRARRDGRRADVSADAGEATFSFAKYLIPVLPNTAAVNSVSVLVGVDDRGTADGGRVLGSVERVTCGVKLLEATVQNKIADTISTNCLELLNIYIQYAAKRRKTKHDRKHTSVFFGWCNESNDTRNCAYFWTRIRCWNMRAG